MTTEDNKALVRRYVDALFQQKNLAVFDELCVPDFVLYNDAVPLQGPEAVKQFHSTVFIAFPDIQMTIEHMLAEGDTVAWRYTTHGTHQGNNMGIPPTGKQVTVTGISFVRISGGKMVEQWTYSDAVGLLRQLGVLPAPSWA
jgi:steroid delta-isomerase-like uncharacterized protein